MPRQNPDEIFTVTKEYETDPVKSRAAGAAALRVLLKYEPGVPSKVRGGMGGVRKKSGNLADLDKAS